MKYTEFKKFILKALFMRKKAKKRNFQHISFNGFAHKVFL